jgi:hypothetical protein
MLIPRVRGSLAKPRASESIATNCIFVVDGTKV